MKKDTPLKAKTITTRNANLITPAVYQTYLKKPTDFGFTDL